MFKWLLMQLESYDSVYFNFGKNISRFNMKSGLKQPANKWLQMQLTYEAS